MQSFLAQLELILSTFPPTILKVLAPMLGSLCSAIVLAIATDVIATPKQIAGQFVVGWLAGAFGGPFLAQWIKLPEVTIGFLGGGIGYWGFTKYRQKQLDKILTNDNKPTNPDGTT